MCRAVELFGELVMAVLTLKKFPFLFNLKTATAHAKLPPRRHMRRIYMRLSQPLITSNHTYICKVVFDMHRRNFACALLDQFVAAGVGKYFKLRKVYRAAARTDFWVTPKKRVIALTDTGFSSRFLVTVR